MPLIKAQLAMEFPQAIERVTEELKKEGFGILSQIDVQAALREKIGENIPPYRILGACNPKLAHRAVTSDPDIGRFLPCNVLVREDGPGKVAVVFADPLMLTADNENPQLKAVASEAFERLNRVRDALAQ
jgi:uncharacterized protein (DUF302 family)